VPTVQEAVGLEWSVAHWRGVVAPRGLPDGLRQRFLEAFRKVEQDPDFQTEARTSSFTLRWRHGDDFARYMDEDDAQFGQVIQRLGATSGSAAGLY
jgi:tripartite-type tricarboxylate transporter receptor subunit TctC